MREYLEAVELLAEGAVEEPEFIRADITGKTEAEITSIQSDIEDVMTDRDYTLQRHYCGHDEGLPCRREVR